MGPIELFYSWQAILVVLVVYMTTQAVKVSLNIAFGGQKKRQSNVWVTRVLLPALPPLLGALAALLPVHPVTLVDYVLQREFAWWEGQLVFSAWGAGCGQFADYLYTKIKRLLQDTSLAR